MGGKEKESQVVTSSGRGLLSPSARPNSGKELILFKGNLSGEEGETFRGTRQVEDEFAYALDRDVVANSLGSKPIATLVVSNKFEALDEVQEENDQKSMVPTGGEEHMFTDHIRKVDKAAEECNAIPVMTHSQGKKKEVNQPLTGPAKDLNIRSKGKPKGAKRIEMNILWRGI